MTTGEGSVFLRIREDEPQTLNYHLDIPNEDAQMSLIQTAVSQAMSICLLAVQSSQRNHAWERAAKKVLQRCKIDYEAILRAISETERKQSPSSVYRGGRKSPNLNRSPYFTRKCSTCLARKSPLKIRKNEPQSLKSPYHCIFRLLERRSSRLQTSLFRFLRTYQQKKTSLDICPEV